MQWFDTAFESVMQALAMVVGYVYIVSLYILSDPFLLLFMCTPDSWYPIYFIHTESATDAPPTAAPPTATPPTVSMSSSKILRNSSM